MGDAVEKAILKEVEKRLRGMFADGVTVTNITAETEAERYLAKAAMTNPVHPHRRVRGAGRRSEGQMSGPLVPGLRQCQGKRAFWTKRDAKQAARSRNATRW